MDDSRLSASQRLPAGRTGLVTLAFMFACIGSGTAHAQADTVSLVTPTGVLYGTMLTPSSAGPHPFVVIIAGSGPTDRDGNSAALPGKNNSLKMLAESLAARGIASVRYDKRGIAESRAALGRSEAGARFDSYADDAAAWVLKYRTDARFSTITIIGHSEGSLLGMLAARSAHADGYVSIAGAGRPAPAVLHEQLVRQLQPAMLARSDTIMRSLAAGTAVDSVPFILRTLFRPSVQPYLMSWFKFDPAVEIATLPMPVMVMQGTSDLQVSMEDARRLAGAQPHAAFVVIEGMNHIMKPVQGSQAAQLPSYSDPSLLIVNLVPDSIAAFVRRLPVTPIR